MQPVEIEHLVANSEAFPILRRWDFFNHAGVSPLPQVAADAFRTFAAEAEAEGYLNTTWYKDVEKVRDLAAGLINAGRDEIALLKNTSEGIATVAGGLQWNSGDRIVTTNVEYPANIYPWMDLQKRKGVELVMVEERDAGGPGAGPSRAVPLERILEEAAHPRTRMVALSHVEFASGQRHDVAAIGKFCRENGKLFCVDGIQSVGVLPVDVLQMNIDFLSADGHKWMLGPEGAGIFYVRRELLDELHPVIIGWMNVAQAEDFGTYDFTLKKSAAKFEAGSHNVPGFLSLARSLEMIRGIGIGAISERVRRLTDLLVGGLTAKGYQVVSPREAEAWSGIVSFVSPTHDHGMIFRTLRNDRRIELALRNGRLRCSPHFYNTEAQIERLISLLPGH